MRHCCFATLLLFIFFFCHHKILFILIILGGLTKSKSTSIIHDMSIMKGKSKTNDHFNLHIKGS